MNYKNTISSRLYRGAVGILALTLIGSCVNKSDINHFADSDSQQGLNISVEEPVERDFDDIKQDGTLKVITRYSSNTYFLHQGLEYGFEYELINKFADEHDLALDIVIIGPEDNPYDMLNSGKGDVIAANYAATEERKKYVDFTRPYNLVDQVLVFSDDIQNPPQSIEEVIEHEIPITVRRNSSYYYRLQDLRNQGMNLPVDLVSNTKDTESLLFDISSNNYKATIADDNIFQASNKYMQGLQKGPEIAKHDTIAWAVRKNSQNLKSELNNFLYDHFRFGKADEKPKRSSFLNILRKRYFESGPQLAEYYSPESDQEDLGIISPYDDLIKQTADSADIDWLLVASIVAQETKFNPQSKSWAGAVGLMQVLPRYSEVSNEELLYNEEINVKEGISILKEHLQHYSYMDSTNQWSFALAAYNAGQGHVADARRLAIDHNKNPNEWENVADALLKLMHRKYYKDARYGFCRGIETVRYVREVKNRYQTYKSIIAMREYEQENRSPEVVGVFN